jgi:hypothetical protein
MGDSGVHRIVVAAGRNDKKGIRLTRADIGWSLGDSNP